MVEAVEKLGTNEVKDNLIKASKEFLDDFSWKRVIDEPDSLDDYAKFKHALMHFSIDIGQLTEIVHTIEHRGNPFSEKESARINQYLGRIFASCFIASKYSPLGNSDQMLQIAANFLTKDA